MKIRLFTLTLLCAAGLAHADGVPGAPAAGAAPASAEMPAPARHKVPTRTLKRLPRGDLRHCLELESNEAVIRCAEKPRRR